MTLLDIFLADNLQCVLELPLEEGLSLAVPKLPPSDRSGVACGGGTSRPGGGRNPPQGFVIMTGPFNIHTGQFGYALLATHDANIRNKDVSSTLVASSTFD